MAKNPLIWTDYGNQEDYDAAMAKAAAEYDAEKAEEQSLQDADDAADQAEADADARAQEEADNAGGTGTSTGADGDDAGQQVSRIVGDGGGEDDGGGGGEDDNVSRGDPTHEEN